MSCSRTFSALQRHISMPNLHCLVHSRYVDLIVDSSISHTSPKQPHGIC
jgi:hypothetical protein